MSVASSRNPEQIIVDNGRRELDASHVEDLSASISELGLLNPITITRQNVLIAGRHRLEAIRKLGWANIPVVVVDYENPLLAELAEIEENIRRKQLSWSDECRAIARHKAIYEELHPETKHGENQHTRSRNNCDSTEPEAPRFTEALSTATGKSERTIQQKAALGKALQERPELAELPTAAAAMRELAPRESPIEVEDAPETIEIVAANETLPAAKPHVAHNGGNNEWYSPDYIVERARTVMGGIDLDPASTDIANTVVKATKIYTANQDGLCRRWLGRVWMNPPYASDLIGKFCEKLVESYLDGHVEQAIVLVNNATETKWFRTVSKLASGLCLPEGRVRFWHPDRESAPLQGQAILYIGTQKRTFSEQFHELGEVWTR